MINYCQFKSTAMEAKMTLNKIFLFVWGGIQIIISWQLLIFFFLLPNTKDKDGDEVVYLLGQPLKVDHWGLQLPGGQMNLQTIVFVVAGIYLLVGVLQTLPLPEEARWRGTWIANMLTSLSVSGMMLWVWYRLIWETDYHITLFQQQVFWAFLFVSIIDTLCSSMS